MTTRRTTKQAPQNRKGVPDLKTEGKTPVGVQTRPNFDQERAAVSILLGLDHRRTGRSLNDLAPLYGLSPEKAALHLSTTTSELQDVLGTYRRELEASVPLPVHQP